MTVLRNNFDGGPDATTITLANSGGVPGNNAFDFVGGSGTGVVRQYAAEFARPTAEFTAHFATAAVSSSSSVAWTTSMGSQSQIWFREYVLITSYPTGGINPTVYECDNGAVYNAFVAIQVSTGKFIVVNSAQDTSSTFVSGISLNTWYRLEGRFQFSATTGNWELRLYGDADSDTPSETLSATNWNLGASTSNSYMFGYAFANINHPHMYISGLELNNEGWPGPAPFRPGKGVPGILSTPLAVHGDAN